jgi:hypothetical protein
MWRMSSVMLIVLYICSVLSVPYFRAILNFVIWFYGLITVLLQYFKYWSVLFDVLEWASVTFLSGKFHFGQLLCLSVCLGSGSILMYISVFLNSFVTVQVPVPKECEGARLCLICGLRISYRTLDF